MNRNKKNKKLNRNPNIYVLSILIISLSIPILGCSKERNSIGNNKGQTVYTDRSKNIAGYKLITKENQNIFLRLLSLADKEYIPKKNIRNDGSTYYSYKRNRFQGELTLEQIKRLISNPPDYSNYRKYITLMFNYLRKKGISISIKNLGEDGPSALWIYELKMIQINSEAFKEGTIAFAKMLNHEVIHIAQSCNRGSVNSPPKLLGLKSSLNREKKYYLSNKIYSELDNYTKKLESEAYANQDNLKLGISLIKSLCK